MSTPLLISTLGVLLLQGCSSRPLLTDGDLLTSVGGGAIDRGYDVAVDSHGNALVVGFFQGQVAIDTATVSSNGNSDVLMGKLDPDGGVLWLASAGGPGLDTGRSIAVDAEGNALVTGSFDGQVVFGDTVLSCNGDDDVFVAKLSPTGQVLWAISFGGPGHDEGHGIAVDAGGAVYVTGLFNEQASLGGAVLTSGGSHDIFVAKLSPAGHPLWASSAGGPGRDIGDAIALDADGNIYLTGRVDPRAAIGSTALASRGHWDLFVAKLSPTGQALWAASAGGRSDNDGGNDVTVDADGNPIVIGSFEGQAVIDGATLASAGKEDTLVAKLSSDGTRLWSTSIGGSGRQLGHALAPTPDGTVVVAGFFEGDAALGASALTAGGGGDLFVATLSSDGQLLEATTAGGTGGRCTANGITMSADGRLLVVGAFNGTATFGATQRVAVGGDDLFLWRLDPP